MSATYPYKAGATLKYKSPPGSGSPPFSFNAGDTLTVLKAADDEGDWFEGQTIDGNKGVFPSSFVTPIEDRVDAPDTEAAAVRGGDDGPVANADEPTSPVQNAAKEVTASSQAANTSVATSAPVTESATSPQRSTSPPETPTKPMSLRDKIAALEAANKQAAAAPPPVPRSSRPFVFKKPAATPAPVPPSSSGVDQSVSRGASTSPPPAAAPLPINATSPVDEKATTTNKAFSAEDARESIGKGGSLKDRIAALQGMTLDTPTAPGRAPKPWKKKSVEVPAEEQEGQHAGPSEAVVATEPSRGDDDEAEVKDDVPGVTDTTAESESAHVPGFEPAEEAEESTETATTSYRTQAQPFVAQPLDDNANMDGSEPTPCDPNFDESQAGKQEASTAAIEEGSSANPGRVGGDAEEDDKDKRAAIAARMAGLGGQRVGMAMPALPKRAGPPRRKAPAATSAPLATETTPNDGVDSNDGSVDKGVAAAGAAIGAAGAGGLLAATKENDDGQDADDDADDFDTPMLPKPTAPAPAPAAPVVDHSTNENADVEPQLQAVEPAEPELADDEGESVETSPAEVAGVPPPLPAGRPPVPPTMTTTIHDTGDDNIEQLPLAMSTDGVEPGVTEATPPPISPLTRPPIPPSFAAGQFNQDDEDEVAQNEDEIARQRDIAVAKPISSPESATSPLPAVPKSTLPPVPPPGRPAIPSIPATFASTSPVETEERKTPIEIPRGEPLIVENDVQPEVEGETNAEPGVIDAGEESGQQADVEDEATAPPPPPPGRPAPPVVATLGETEGGAVSTESTQEQQVAEADENEQDDEEEEDPEIARRRAIAARMAKLGGMNMRMGPMIPPIGGVRKPPQATKKKSESEEQSAGTAPADEGNVSEDTATPPPRRIPGLPVGGFALPGIVPARPPPSAEADEDEQVNEDTEARAEDAAPEAERDEAQAPPPLPQGRPPVPASTGQNELQSQQAEEQSTPPPPLPSGRPPAPTANIDEPEQADEMAHDGLQTEGRERAEETFEQSPAPPPRPAGGLPPPPPSSVPPPLPTQAIADAEQDEAPPTSPTSRSGGGAFGLFKPKSRQGSVPSLDHVTSRNSVEASRSSFEGADVQRSNSVQSTSASKPLPAVSEGSSYPPQQLVQFSTTLGAQVFAAAHTKLSDKSSRESRGGEGLLEFCLSRATNPKLPSSFVYGATVLQIEGGKGGGVVSENDEPRAGDVVVFHDTKFKHNLSTTRVGTAQAPFVAVVASWDSKKRKLKTIEVNAKDSQVEEGSHRLEDLKQGAVVIYRVVPDSNA
ncbi:assembly of actin patch protein [Microbotryomycetes sp. JL221]|nr:assembly of actin patch protein [Microbotryomycetes sp. JL221]